MTRSPLVRWLLIALVALLIALAARALWQQGSPPNEPAPTVAAGSATPDATVAPDASTPPDVVTTPAPSEETATAEPTPETATGAATAEPPVPGEVPAPTLFDQPWADRSLWSQGLVESARPRAEALDGATIYHMRIDVAEGYRRVAGEQEVHYTNTETEPLDEIYFRLFPNLFGGAITIDALTLNGEPVTGQLELEESALRLPLAQPLEPGASVVVGMTYRVEVPEVNEQNYGAFAFTADVLALAHAYPLIPAYDESGWNVEIPAPSGDVIYADSSFYLVELTMPEGTTMAASGTVIEEQGADGRTTQTIVAGPVRDFYMAGSPAFVEVSEQRGETTLRSYALPGQEEVNAEVLRIGAETLELFNALYGPYPYTELELASTPNLALGIEYPGVVVMTERLYREDGFAGNVPRGALLESTVVHEVGHQWFYSTVGNDQLDAPWLDEALAQYVTYRYYETLGAQAAAGFEASLRDRWERVGEADIPIGLPVEEYNAQEYGAIVYGRGPLFFIDALEEEIGQDTVDDFLRAYYDQFYFGIATGEGMREVAERTCGCDLNALWDAWVLPEE